MSLYETEYLQSIVNNKNLGAGNFMKFLGETSPKSSDVALELDFEIETPSGTTKTLSIDEINDYSARLSEWYVNYGIEEKDPVCLYFDDSIIYFLHFVALTNIGAIPVFTNGKLEQDILFKFIKTTDAKLLLCNTAIKESLLQTAKYYCKSLDVIAVENIDMSSLKGDIKYYNHSPNDPVLLGHTSGTTGIPKAVQFNHEGFFFGVRKQIFKMVGERIMSALPHSHASAISISMSGLLRGAIIKIQSRKESNEVLVDIEDFKPDLFVSFPKVYVDICRLDLDSYNLDSIKYWLSTGDANHEPHIKKLMSYGSRTIDGKQYEGSIFIDNLGSSEIGFAAFRNVHKPSDDNFKRSIGKPFDWVDAEILGKDGNALSPNEVGYLGINAKCVTVGYWNNSLMTEKNRLGGYWLTGDLAYKSEEGIFYHVDRITDQIVTDNGVIYSCEVEESILREFPEIFDCSVYAETQNDGAVLPAINVELDFPMDPDNLHVRLNDVMDKNGHAPFASLSLNSSNMNVGITGKMLKRVMRGQAVKT